MLRPHKHPCKGNGLRHDCLPPATLNPLLPGEGDIIDKQVA
jgi:hypothetical protein